MQCCRLETHLAPNALHPAVLLRDLRDSLEALHDSFAKESSFSAISDRIIDDLYRNEFQSFLKYKLVDQAKVRLGVSADQQDRGDLGGMYTHNGVAWNLTSVYVEVFCLTNPRWVAM